MDGKAEISRRRALIALSALAVVSGDEVRRQALPKPQVVSGPSVHPVSKPFPAPSIHGPVPVRRAPARNVHEVKKDAPKRAVALTIDDGPHPKWTPRVLDLLAKHEIQATFFVIGSQIPDHAKLVRRIVEEGHEIANHTLTHPIFMPGLSDWKMQREITEAHRRIHEETGAIPHLFRAPGGNWSKRLFKAVAHHGMVPIDWDIDPQDWRRPGAGRITRALLKAKPGDILLCHDGGGDRSQTLSSLKTAIPRLKDRGYKFVTL